MRKLLLVALLNTSIVSASDFVMPFEWNVGSEYDLGGQITWGYTVNKPSSSYYLTDDGTRYFYTYKLYDDMNLFQTTIADSGLSSIDIPSRVNGEKIYSIQYSHHVNNAVSKQYNIGCMQNRVRHTWDLPRQPDVNGYYDYSGEESLREREKGLFKISPNGKNYAIFYDYYDDEAREDGYGVATNQSLFLDCSNVQHDLIENHQHILYWSGDELRDELGEGVNLSDKDTVDSVVLDDGSTATVFEYKDRRSYTPLILKTILVTRNAKGELGYAPIETSSRGEDGNKYVDLLRIQAFHNGFVIAYRVTAHAPDLTRDPTKIKLQFWKAESGKFTRLATKTIVPSQDQYLYGGKCHMKSDYSRPAIGGDFDIDSNYDGKTIIAFTNGLGNSSLLEHYLFDSKGDILDIGRQKIYSLKYDGSPEEKRCDMDYLQRQLWESHEWGHPVVSINNSGRYSILTQRKYAGPYGADDIEKSHGKIVIRDYKY